MQPLLFDVAPVGRRPVGPCRSKLDPQSEGLLAQYQGRRLARGAHPRTVRGEVSQLRSLARQHEGSLSLPELFAEPGRLARVLLEPTTPIAWSTGRRRLVAAQRFVRECGPAVGIRDVDSFLAALDRLLPTHTQREWHSAGTIVGGSKARRRPQSPTLLPSELQRIVDAVGIPDGYRRRRDRAIVALHCYSGLKPDEIVGLQWSQVRIGTQSEEVIIEVQRAGRLLRLPVVGPAASSLVGLCWPLVEGQVSQNGYVLRRGEWSEHPLTARAVRQIVQRACARAGFPLATAVNLRAAFGYWLKLRGLSDHEAAAVLGLKQVRTLDQLLARHRALDAQRQVRELRAR